MLRVRALEHVDIVDVAIAVLRMRREVAGDVREAAQRRGVEVVRARDQERGPAQREGQGSCREQRPAT